MKRYDERNTLFSRVHLKKDTEEYNKYYELHPKAKYKDDQLRNIDFRETLRKPQQYKDLFFPITSHNKSFIKSMHDLVENTEVNSSRVAVPQRFARNIKEITKYYGATSVGLTTLHMYSYYSHLGGVSEKIGKDTYNKLVKDRFDTAIIFSVAMDKEMINRAPHYEELLATEEAYLKVAHIGARLALYIKELGYKASFYSSEYYEAPLVPLAYDAGIGEIGMANHIVTKEHGNNIRLGAVFTTLQLDTDQPVDFGLQEFCKQCTLCLMNCPSKAIKHQKREVNGRPFYKFDDNACYEMWTKMGTDCGTCISACPFTQGLPLKEVDKMKENPNKINELITTYLNQHGRRVRIPHDLNIVALDKE